MGMLVEWGTDRFCSMGRGLRGTNCAVSRMYEEGWKGRTAMAGVVVRRLWWYGM